MGEIIVGMLGSVVNKLIDYSVDLIKKPVRYLCFYSCNVNQLREEVSKVEIEINTVNEKIQNKKDEWGDIRIPANVEAWRVKVERIKNDSDQILNEAEQIKKTHLSKWIPFLHWSLSRKAQKTTESAVQRENPKEFDPVAYPLIAADLPPIPTTSEISLKSRLSLEEEIIDALKQNDVYLIGIHGMGGVGKTTMVNNIERKVAEKRQDLSKMFEITVKAVVSQVPDPLQIQEDIAEGLSLKLEDKNQSNRAKRLHASLLSKQSVLIIFDDVWDRLELETIGIPSQSTHVGCKLLLASRDRKALTSTAENPMIFPLNVLKDDEAWVLFRKNAGNSIDSPELHYIAEQVCRECKGLPLALEVVGRALNGESKACWEHAFAGLQKSMPDNIPKVLGDVYKPLLLSFNKLETDEYRDLLLLCCLFEEDSNISHEELVMYGMGLGMFERMEDLSEVRNKVESMVGHLISRSLLLESSDYLGNQCVKMHDVVRDVGIHMKQDEFLISHGRKEWPKIIEEGYYGNYTHISLTTSSEENTSFPVCKECPRLQLLRVAYNGSGTLKLPNNLFTSTSRSESLKVLEIGRFDSLPSSIHMLKNLRTLCLVHSRLESVSVIGELRNLEILHLRWCEFDVLPKKIGELKKLKKLDVINRWRLEKIEYGVVSGLVQLEELIILGERSLEWGVEEDGQGINDKSCLAELNSLNHLTTLCIQISNSNAIPKEMPLWVHNVKKYSIRISVRYCSDLGRFQRAIHLGDDTALLGDWFYDHIARNAECLEFCGISCSNVVNKLISSGYQSTRVLNFKWCNNVKYLSHALFEGRQNGPIFPVLKILDIEGSDSLEVICNGAPPTRSFKELEEIHFRNLTKLTFPWTFSCEKFYLSVLKIIRIEGCDKLLYIFPLAVCLPQLQRLEVSNCPAIQEIFKREEGSVENVARETESNTNLFPKLKRLTLRDLPVLLAFCHNMGNFELPSLELLDIRDCPMMETFCKPFSDVSTSEQVTQFFFTKEVSFPNLQSLWLGNIKAARIFNENIPTDSFCRLEKLTVRHCERMTSVFSDPNIFRRLTGLTLETCGELQEVIAEVDQNIKITLRPQLRHLVLRNLPKMHKFCHHMDKLEFSSLETLSITDCPMMETFCTPFSVSSLSKLEQVTPSFFNNEVSFPKLWYLVLNNIKATRIFSENIPNIFTRLIHLNLESCGELQEVITQTNTNLFPQLKKLILAKLPVLLAFCHNFELPSLELLDIRDCPMMETFCKPFSDVSNSEQVTQFFFTEEVSFPNLKELWLINIKAARIFGENIPIDSFCRLQFLRVINCDIMKNVFSVLNIFRCLTTLVLKSCGELEEVIAEEDQNIKITICPELQYLKLKRLPKMHKFCHHMDKLEFSSLEELIIRDCPMMETFCTPFSVSSLSKQVALDVGLHISTQVTPSFFNNEVLFPNLSTLELGDIKVARIFGENIPIDSLCRLKDLTVKNCDRMRNVFSDPNIFTSLRELNLDSCGELQEVIADEHQNIKTTLLFPQLENLDLRRLPKMHKFCHIKDDLELPSLFRVTIDDCPMLETFSLGRLHLPVLKQLRGLSDPDFATNFFFHKEKSSHKSRLDNYCFTISATDLSFDTQSVPSWILTPDVSDRNFFRAAVLNFYKSMYMIEGKLETGKLVEGVLYEIILIIRHDAKFGKEKSLLSKLILHGEVQHHHNEAQNNIDEMPRGKWIEIIVGEFIREPHYIEDLEFSISLRFNGTCRLWIKGIVIRSKCPNE